MDKINIGPAPKVDEFYFEKEIQADFDLGKEDGLAGKMNSRRAKKWRAAYLSGYEIGFAIRAAGIREKRIANVTKARKSKIIKEGENGK